jgi:hypothetical protein
MINMIKDDPKFRHLPNVTTLSALLLAMVALALAWSKPGLHEQISIWQLRLNKGVVIQVLVSLALIVLGVRVLQRYRAKVMGALIIGFAVAILIVSAFQFPS